MSKYNIFEWHKSSIDDREATNYDFHALTSNNFEIVGKVRIIIGFKLTNDDKRTS